MKPWQYRSCTLIWITLFLLLIVSSGLLGQVTSGTLHCQVTDPSGAVVTDATVLVTSEAGQTSAAQASKDGGYEIKGLAPGKYTVKAVAQGFALYEQQGVVITAGQVQQLSIKIQIEVQQEKVEVTGEAAQVSVSSENNASALVIQGKDLEALSDDPDELQSELEALAGPAAGPNGGQIYIDGFTAGQLPPKSSIREIRINQNPFSAQYDKLGYGRIEIFTKPGTDQYHGQLMVNGNDSAFNSRNPFAPEVPSYHSFLFDGNIGGPISKKASFFFDGQRRNIDNAAVVSAFVLGPPPTFDQVPYNQAVLTPQTRTNISPRVDYQVSKNNTLTARYQFWQNHETNQGVGQFALPEQGYNIGTTEQTLQVSDTQVVGEGAVNETHFQYLHQSSNQSPLSGQPTYCQFASGSSANCQVSVLGAFTGGGNSMGQIVDTENHYELQNYTSMSRGKHLLRFGGRLRYVQQANSSTANFNSTFTFPSLDAYQITELGLQQGLTPVQIRAAGGGASQFLVVTGNPVAHVDLFDAGLYAEDDWRLRPNMTLNIGLRFETQNDIGFTPDFGPRVGFAWGLGGGKSPKTVLRAGGGIFFDRFGPNPTQSQLLTNPLLQAERLNGITQQQYVVAQPNFYPTIPPVSELSMLSAGNLSPTVYQIAPSLQPSYTIQGGVGVERKMKPRSERKRSTQEVMDDMRSQIAENIPGLDVEFTQILQDMLGDLEGSPEPVELKIFGNDMATLEHLAEEVQPKLQKIPGLVDFVGIQKGNPEIFFHVDPTVAGRAGLGTDNVTQQVSAGLLGLTESQFREADRTIDIRVRFPDAFRYNYSDIQQFPLLTPAKQIVPLSSLAQVQQVNGESALQRENQRLMVTLTARLENRDLGSGIRDVQKMMDGITLPTGTTYEIGGQYESQQSSFHDLLKVLCLALGTVFIVLVVQFRAFPPALIILSAAPLSLVGVFAMLLITGTPLNVSSFMGIILMVGLVVKNGIILFEYVHKLWEEEKMPLGEALVAAGKIRIRPILMTTLATLFGLLPLALGLGSGAELQKPLALAVIGGLLLSTFITLLVMPVLYSLLERKAESA